MMTGWRRWISDNRGFASGSQQDYDPLAAILALLKEIKARLGQRPTHIALELPRVTKKGKVMPNYELANDEVSTITIKTTNSAGAVEPYPTGDVFSVTSSNPASLGVAIGADAAGNPAVVLTPLVQASPNITVTVSDSAGLIQAVQLVDIVQDVKDTNIILDVADAVLKSQPVPTAPGP
jgi:hypothetical protein